MFRPSNTYKGNFIAVYDAATNATQSVDVDMDELILGQIQMVSIESP